MLKKLVAHFVYSEPRSKKHLAPTKTNLRTLYFGMIGIKMILHLDCLDHINYTFFNPEI